MCSRAAEARGRRAGTVPLGVHAADRGLDGAVRSALAGGGPEGAPWIEGRLGGQRGTGKAECRAVGVAVPGGAAVAGAGCVAGTDHIGGGAAGAVAGRADISGL